MVSNERVTQALTVVYLAPRTGGVIDLITELSQVGMMRPIVLFDSELVATLVADGAASPIDFDVYTAESGIGYYRLIAFGLAGEPVQERILDEVERQTQRLTAVGATVIRISLTAAPHGEPIDHDAFPPYWNRNLVLESTDSAGEPNYPTLDLVDERRLLAVATSALALIGGSWAFLSGGPLDDADGTDGVANQARVRMIRSTTRVVDAGGIAAQAVSTALGTGVRLPPPPGCVRHGAPGAVLDDVVRLILPPSGDDSPLGFAYRLPPPSGPSERHELTWIDAIKLYARELVLELKRLPYEALEQGLRTVRTRVGNAIQSNTFGPDSTIGVRFAQVDSVALLDQQQRIQEVASLPEIVRSMPPETPTVWTTLSALVLGLADGSEMPAGFVALPLEWGGTRGVVNDTTLLVSPDLATSDGGAFRLSAAEAKGLGWDGSHEVVIAGNDPVAADAVLTRARSVLPPPIAKVEEPNVSDESSAQSTADQADEEHASAEQPPSVAERLAEWVAAREGTLLWTLARRVAQEEQRALAELSAASSELGGVMAELTSAVESETQSRRRFRKRALFAIVAFFLWLALGVTGIVLSLVVSAITWAASMVVVGFIFVWTVFRLVRRRVREKFALRDRSNLPDRITKRRQHAADEFARLASLYAQLLDWATVYAYVLHRPFGERDNMSPDPWTTDFGALSFVSGRAHIDPEDVDAISLSATQYVARRGWATTALAWQRDLIVREYLQSGGAMGGGGEPEADNAVDQGIVARVVSQGREVAIYPPRRNLVTQISDGDAARRFRDQMFEALERVVAQHGPLNVISRVECDISGLNNPPRDVHGFLLPILRWAERPPFTSVGAVRRVQGVEIESIVGLTSGVEPEGFEPVGSPVDVRPLVNRTTLVAFRLDLSEPLDLSDVDRIKSHHGAAGDAGPEPVQGGDGVSW